MKTYDFKFYKFRDRKPPDGSVVMYIDEQMYYGSYEFKFGEVEYMWEEYDKDGHPTGHVFHNIDDPENPSPELHRVITIDGHDVDDHTLWAPTDEMEKVLEQSDEDEKTLALSCTNQ